MIARLYSTALMGIDGYEVQVEADAYQVQDAGRISLVGLPDAAVKESIQRVSSAIINSQFYPPTSMVVTVNLAPADLKKQGPGFDLAIALSIEIAIQQNHRGIPKPAQRKIPQHLEEWCIIGELALDGQLRAVRGILALAHAAKKQGRRYLMLPAENAQEASLIQGLHIYPVNTLAEAWDTLLHHAERPKPSLGLSIHDRNEDDAAKCGDKSLYAIDFEEVKGQVYARRALEIAAAGGHNVLLCGSPGSGKSMLASRFPSILPELSLEECLEASKIHSICGLLDKKQGLLLQRPFRAPHHTISDVGLMGGGSQISPGEITLAHRGVLFLDELPEFNRRTLETLRQPLESRQVTISRASGTMDFPCHFMLLAAMNPCPCGYHGDPQHSCRCSPADLLRYRKKISGPLLDRFDIIIEVPPVPTAALLSEKGGGESSASIRARVLEACARQVERYENMSIKDNASLSGKQIRQFCPLSKTQKQILLQACEQMQLSARAFDRILRVMRSIADLAGREIADDNDLYEAIQLRSYEARLRS